MRLVILTDMESFLVHKPKSTPSDSCVILISKRGVNSTRQDSSKESLKDRYLINSHIRFLIPYLNPFESP
jgi:hypothetical protein